MGGEYRCQRQHIELGREALWGSASRRGAAGVELVARGGKSRGAGAESAKRQGFCCDDQGSEREAQRNQAGGGWRRGRDRRPTGVVRRWTTTQTGLAFLC